MDIQEQLLELRRKIARIDRKYANATPAPAPVNAFQRPRPDRYFVEELMSGEVVGTSFGAHFETEKLYERHRRHGSMDISSLIELPEDLPKTASRLTPKDEAWCGVPPAKSALLAKNGVTARIKL